MKLVATYLWVLLLCSCPWNPAAIDSRKGIKIIELAPLIRDRVRAIEQRYGVKPIEIIFTLKVMDEKGDLLETAEVMLRRPPNQAMPILADFPGIFTIGVREELMKADDLTIEVYVRGYNRPFRIDLPSGTSQGIALRTQDTAAPQVKNLGEGVVAKRLSRQVTLLNKKVHKSRHIPLFVYYEDADGVEAAVHALAFIEEVYQQMNQLLRTPPVLPFSVVIMTSATEPSHDEDLFIAKPNTHLYRILKDGRKDEYLVHEWGESSINAIVNLHADPSNRWISDGLAELLSYEILAKVGDREWISSRLQQNISWIDSLLQRGYTEYDLTSFQWDLMHRLDTQQARLLVGGYAVSFAFWYDLLEQHGRETLARFLHGAASLRRRDNKTLVKLLEKLTGEENLGDRIPKIKLNDVKRRLMEARKRLLPPILHL
jgi:hypothetical protein